MDLYSFVDVGLVRLKSMILYEFYVKKHNRFDEKKMINLSFLEVDLLENRCVSEKNALPMFLFTIVVLSNSDKKNINKIFICCQSEIFVRLTRSVRKRRISR